MLVLSRRVGESIVIGDDVVITVLEVRGDIVRVGVNAPRSVAIHREELLREVADTNRASANASDDAVAHLSSLVGSQRRPRTADPHSRPAQQTRTADPPSPSS